MLKPVSAAPKEVIFQKGEPSQALFFLIKGQVEVISGVDGRVLYRIRPGMFFGESVPRSRLAAADRTVESADAMLIVGTSLVVWSGYRLARLAAQRGIPLAAVNNGLTRADGMLEFKLEGDCGTVLGQALSTFSSQGSSDQP